MQLLDFIECSARRGLRCCHQWLLDYETHLEGQVDKSEVKSPATSIYYMRIKALFDVNDFERVIAITSDQAETMDREVTSLVLLSRLLLFNKNQRSIDITGAMVSQSATDGEYANLRKFGEVIHARFSNDSVINYLYAMVVKERPEPGDSRYVIELLIRAIKQAPFNWASWMELASMDDHLSDEVEVYLKNQELYPFYRLEKLKRMRKFKQVIMEITKLGIKGWTYLDHLEGSCYHELRDFASAALSFEAITKRDKYCVNGMDEYSNCLFVLERESDLCQLASHTSIIVGNNHSLKGDHEKAAMFFKRATTVDAKNVNAWLLLGHELIELRNPSAAFAAYQKAAQCPSASNDMRPWYAMGQLFELINQMAFAVFYHNKAVQIQPKDPRVWKALSGCYLKLNRVDESSFCNSKVQALSSDSLSAMAI